MGKASQAGAVGRIEQLESRTMLAVHGLSATYFDNANLTGATVKRIDPAVNFNWGTGSPSPSIGVDTFSARWTGQVQPETSGTYTFYTRTNDGVRLWVNGQLLVNKWVSQGLTEGQGSINLVAGQKYSLKMEFFENTGSALAQLLWSGPGVTKRVIPTGRLWTETPPEPAPLAAPTGLVAKATGPRRVELSWNDVAGEAGYKIERKLDGPNPWTQIGTTPANVTKYVDEAVEPGKSYVYRVRAFAGDRNSLYSNTAGATTPAEGTTPAVPGDLRVVEVGANYVRLAWNDVAGETGYKVERRVDGSAVWNQIGTTAANVTTYKDEQELVPGKTYFYRVRANNGELNSPYSNVVSATIPGGPVRPAAPRELRVTGITTDGVSLAWYDVAGETGYEVQRRLDGTPVTSFAKIGETAANVTTFTDHSVEKGKTYVYRVIALNGTLRSEPSNTAYATIPGDAPGVPGMPTNLRVTSASAAAGISLAWNDVTGELGYEVYRRIDGVGGYVYTSVGTTDPNVTTFTDTSIEAGHHYIYVVEAFNTAGDSGYSNTAGATV